MKRLSEVGIGPAHGYLHIYSAPRAVAKHIEWGVAEVLGYPVSMNWKSQRLVPGSVTADFSWSALIGSGAKLASALKGWHYLTFEVYESAGVQGEGSLFMFTPELGLFHGSVGMTGNLLIDENQMRSVLRENLKSNDLVEELEKLMGKKWDVALEPFRFNRDGDSTSADRISV